MHLLELRDDPLVPLLLTKTIAHDTFLRAALLGLVPELADMFIRLSGPEPGHSCAAKYFPGEVPKYEAAYRW